jgi:uncharacterized protein
MNMIHLSIPIKSVADSVFFYSTVLGCEATRKSDVRVDFNFFGHHLVAQLSPEEASHQSLYIGELPNRYPLRHFGIVVDPQQYEEILQRINSYSLEIAMPAQTIFHGTAREQEVFLIFDPSGNAIEIKGISNPTAVFASQ